MTALCLFLELILDLFRMNLGTEIVLIHLLLHGDQVDDAAEAVLTADRHLNRCRLGSKTITDRSNRHIEVSTRRIHLVGEYDTRNMIFRSLTPNGFRLRLNTSLGIENRHRAIENTQRTLNFSGEVNVPRCIDDVDLAVLPVAGCSCRCNGNSTLTLLVHPVHLRSTIMGLADLVDFSSVVQDTLRCGCLAGINVGHDTNVANLVDRKFSRHIFSFPLRNYQRKCAKALFASAIL